MIIFFGFLFIFYGNSAPWSQVGFDSHGSYRSKYVRKQVNEWTVSGRGKSGFSYPPQAVIDDKTGSLLVTYTDYFDFPTNVSTYILQLDLEDGSTKSKTLLTTDTKKKPFGVPVVAQVNGESIYILSGWSNDPTESVPIYLGFTVGDYMMELNYKLDLNVDVHTVLWNNVVTGDGILMVEAEEEVDRNQIFGIQYPETSYLWKMGWIMVNRYLSLDSEEDMYFFNSTAFIKLDPKTGKIIANKTIDIGTYGIVDGYDRVYFADNLGLSFMIGESNLARCHDTKSLLQVWETDLSTEVNIKCSNPAVTNDEKSLVFVCSGFKSQNSTVFVLDTSDGSIQYQNPNIAEKNCVIVGNQGVAVFSDSKENGYVVTCQKNLYTFGPDHQMSGKVDVLGEGSDAPGDGFITTVVLDDSDSIYVCYNQNESFNCRRIINS